MPQTTVSVEGESAILTGGGSGIGRQIAAELTDAGVDVVINDIDEQALATTKDALASNPGRVQTVAGDTSNENVAATLVETALEAFGSLEIVVNNVGIAGPTKPCEDIEKEEFLQTLNVNIGSAFVVSKHSIPHLKDGEYGRIVNISSISGKRPLRDRTPYTTSKMGIIGFTRTLATELASYDINVNAICPGSVKGPRLNDVIRKQAENQDRPIKEVEKEFREVSPKNEFVNASNIADAVLFLCSTSADKITGQDINVSAGVVMY